MNEIKPILKLKDIVKRFNAVTALNKVNFESYSGEVHGLLGENGAGKSTLMKILDGIHQADEGEIFLEDRKVNIESPHKAKQLGIVLIHQELSLVPDMSVSENILLGSFPTKMGCLCDLKKMQKKTENILHMLKCNFKSSDKVCSLSIAKKQMVEIARALVFTPKIVLFDEPTASLSDSEKGVLFENILRLKSQGVGIIYISHRMDEIFKITDRISVLRDGEYRQTLFTKDTNEEEITRLMIGRNLKKLSKEYNTSEKKEILSVRNLTIKDLFKNVSFHINKGEILGFYGLVGAGRSEIAETVFGLRKPQKGQIYVEREAVKIKSPTDAIKKGISLVPENRKEQGLIIGMNLKENIALPQARKISKYGWLNKEKELKLFSYYKNRLNLKATGWTQKASGLSGGNQQKIVIGKWLGVEPKILILDEPTRGIDVGSKLEIHNLIRELARSGYAILVISSEMPEIISVCDRIMTLYHGEITGDFSAEKITEDNLVNGITKQDFTV